MGPPTKGAYCGENTAGKLWELAGQEWLNSNIAIALLSKTLQGTSVVVWQSRRVGEIIFNISCNKYLLLIDSIPNKSERISSSGHMYFVLHHDTFFFLKLSNSIMLSCLSRLMLMSILPCEFCLEIILVYLAHYLVYIIAKMNI